MQAVGEPHGPKMPAHLTTLYQPPQPLGVTPTSGCQTLTPPSRIIHGYKFELPAPGCQLTANANVQCLHNVKCNVTQKGNLTLSRHVKNVKQQGRNVSQAVGKAHGTGMLAYILCSSLSMDLKKGFHSGLATQLSTPFQMQKNQSALKEPESVEQHLATEVKEGFMIGRSTQPPNPLLPHKPHRHRN